MIQYRYFLVVFMIKINFISSQICQNDIPDFFYNVDFAGPFFDQTVYTKLHFSVSNPINTSVFNFTVRPQTNLTRPSFFYSTIVNSRALDLRTDDITVTSSDPSFAVQKSNDIYTLVTNTYPLNYFSPFNRYFFQLIATQTFSDQRRPPIMSTAIVQINLKNYNVHAPIFTPDNQIFYISETAPRDTQFGTVYATDPDNDGIVYSTADSQFHIDSSTGVLRLERKIHPSLTEYFLDVTATDDGFSCPSPPTCPKYSNSTKIRIIITAVNRNSPRFLNQICGKNVSFYENNIPGDLIESLIVLDDDRGENGLIDIAFPPEQIRTTVSGLRNTAYSQFDIEQMEQINTTRRAILKTNEIFDYDKPGATRVWYLYVLATDRGKPQRQALCSLSIHLLDLNDNSPVFIMTFWNYTIYNSSFIPNNTRVIAADADSGLNGQINYYIGTRNVPYFSIERETGKIIFRSDISNPSTSLNSSHFPITFQIYAQDRGKPPQFSKNNATVTIYYSNSMNPIPASWLDPSYEELNISIREKFYELYPNQPIFDNNTKFTGSIFYQLTSYIPSIMTISSPFFSNADLPFRNTPVERSGNICKSDIIVTSGLHTEIQSSYFFNIRVLVDPPLIGSVKIELIDENDQIPTFDIRSIVLSVMENENGNRTIAQIQAFDRDIHPDNNRILYSLNCDLSGNETCENFHLESDGTIWTNTTFGREYNKTLYRLFITASNAKPAYNSDRNYTQDFQLDVQVISINNKIPEFNNQEIISINETTEHGSNILNITIVDADIDTNLNLGILSGNIRNTFTFTLLSTNLDNSTRTQYEAIGQLKVVAPLDVQSTPNYTLRLFAFDTKNIEIINVTIHVIPQNTKAPYFDLIPGCTSYSYQVIETMEYSTLGEPIIQAYDPDPSNPRSSLRYEIYDNRRQLNLTNLSLNKIDNQVIINITSPGLSRHLPFGTSMYNFSIRATDENGTGVSSYVPVSIEVTSKNNTAPRPTKFGCINEGINPTIIITFEDYNDPNPSRYQIDIINSSNFTLESNNGIYILKYNGSLNRTLTKSLSVTFNASVNQHFSQVTTISIIVCDQLNAYPISDGSKNIKVIYVKGYQNSLRNVELGSIYVNDLNDWFRVNRTYSIRNVSNGQRFNASQGLLSTSDVLYPGFYNIRVDVTKPNVPSSALSTIDLEIENIDSEYVRQATTIRLQGVYPETLIDPLLGYSLDKLRDALASLFSVNINSIFLLSIRSVFQYQNPYDPPKTLEMQKNEALTDVIFYAPISNRVKLEDIPQANRVQFESRLQIKVIVIGPDPCNNYVCPIGNSFESFHCIYTCCRSTRTIQPKPLMIDTNLTSFVGINILDSADCINSIYPVNLTNNCNRSSINNIRDCSSISLQSYGPLGPYCEVLGRVFDGNGEGYATYAGTSFSNFAPTRFSFDFVLRSPISNGLILLYGRNVPPIDEFFWIAIEIDQLKLKFHFRDTIFVANESELNSSIWYHVEYQFIHSTILLSINDCQYLVLVNNTLNTYNQSTVELYLGGLPRTGQLLSGLYPKLGNLTFNGCIRNVLSNGYYLDMSKNLSSANSNLGECPCSVTNSCITERRISDIIVPWYTWLIMALVLLLLVTILALTLLTCIRRRQQLKVLTGLYTDDTRDNIIDYKENAGEEDHSTYNLRILKKPVYALADEYIIPNDGGLDYNNVRRDYRPALGDYIGEQLNEQVIPYAHDTKLYYQYEGEGSIASNLSSIESPRLSNENNYQFLYSFGPKFSSLADLYAGPSDNDDDDPKF